MVNVNKQKKRPRKKNLSITAAEDVNSSHAAAAAAEAHGPYLIAACVNAVLMSNLPDGQQADTLAWRCFFVCFFTRLLNCGSCHRSQVQSRHKWQEVTIRGVPIRPKWEGPHLLLLDHHAAERSMCVCALAEAESHGLRSILSSVFRLC